MSQLSPSGRGVGKRGGASKKLAHLDALKQVGQRPLARLFLAAAAEQVPVDTNPRIPLAL